MTFHLKQSWEELDTERSDWQAYSRGRPSRNHPVHDLDAWEARESDAAQQWERQLRQRMDAVTRVGDAIDAFRDAAIKRCDGEACAACQAGDCNRILYPPNWVDGEIAWTIRAFLLGADFALNAEGDQKIDLLRTRREPPSLATQSRERVRPGPLGEFVELALESVDGAVVGATAVVDEGALAEETVVEAVDYEARTITVRLERRHGGGGSSYPVKVAPQRTPFPHLSSALTFAMQEHFRIGMGPVVMKVAADRDEDVIQRAILLGRGRLPTVLRVRERFGNLERYACAGGFLPNQFIRAKQDSNGCTGGAKNQGSIDLQLDVMAAVEKAELTELAHVVLFELEYERAFSREPKDLLAKAPKPEETLAAKLEELRTGLRESDPQQWGAQTTFQREVFKFKGGSLAGPTFTAGNVRQLASRSRRAVAEQLELKGLIPPRARRHQEPDRHERPRVPLMMATQPMRLA